MSIESTTNHTRSISAFFDTEGAAQQAVDDLTGAGIPRGQIEFVKGQAGTETAKPKEEKSFWETLTNLFIPDEDRYAYSEGLRRGGYLLVVTCDEAMYPQVLDLLDTDGAVDLDDRQGRWQQDGWTGARDPVSQPTTGFASATALARDASPGSDADYPLGANTAAVASGATAAMAAGQQAPATGTGAFPVPAEQLRVGRRDPDVARSRVRGYRFDAPAESDSSGPSRFAAATDASKIAEHMDVIASDGQKIGTVDHLEGPDAIKLAKSTAPDGQHHIIPLSWVHHVDAHVHLNKATADVKAAW